MRKRSYITWLSLALLATAAAVLAGPSMTLRTDAAGRAQEPAPPAAPLPRVAPAPPVMPEVLMEMEDGDRGWLGVTISEVTAEKAKELKLSAERGVLLGEVEAESPAAKAGLKANDVVTEFNGQRIEGTAQFRRLIRETPPGRAVQLTVWRDGRAQSVSVQLGNFVEHARTRVRMLGPKDFDFHFEMPEMGGNFFTSRRPMLGIDVEDLNSQLGSYFGAPDGEGVLVREVKSGTPAEKAGLKAGDVITKIDGERIRNVSELREKLHARRDKKSVSVGVLRKGAEMSLDVGIEQPKPPEKKKTTISRRTAI